MPVMCTLILDLMLVTSLVGVSMARRPQIAMEELFKKSPPTESIKVHAFGGRRQPRGRTAGASEAGRRVILLLQPRLQAA
ncbi:hypothetical protein V5799_018577 [Amblyomma americanum]|uniref:Secreted protein n=1 Tax=Amblyomma americanum TaxID=6943 RepID=A0AAQ4F038_AMBAM